MSQHSGGNDKKNTSSGHGAHGMGGQPTGDDRDLESGGGENVDKDDRTVQVPGAFGTGNSKKEGGTPDL